MKNKKRILAAAMAFCMIAAATGCGDSKGSEVDYGSFGDYGKNSSAESRAESNSADSEANDSGTVPEADAPSAVSSESLAYYDDLAAEWEKSGDTGFYGRFWGESVNHDTIFGASDDFGRNYYAVHSSGEGAIVLKNGSNNWIGEAYFCNGYVYCSIQNSDTYEYKIEKRDSDGNVVASYTAGEQGAGIIACLPNGHVIFGCEGDEIPAIYVLDSDFETVHVIPNPQVEAEHGLTEEVNLQLDSFGAAMYGSKIYLKEYNSYFDCDTLEWHTYEAPEGWKGFASLRCIGKYTLVNCGSKCIFDMETNTVAFDFPGADAAFQNYYGGDFSIEYDGSGAVSFVQYPSDGSGRVEVKRFDNITGESVLPINTETYAVVDEYGVFLHTYEKGDSEETTALLFE